MSGPRRWRDAPPKTPEGRAAARLVAEVPAHSVPRAAKARVRARLADPEPAGRPVFGHVVAAAAALALLLLVVPFGERAGAPAPGPSVAGVWRAGPSGPATISVEGLARFELAPDTELRRLDPESIDVALVRGEILVARPSAGLRIIAGRYAVAPSPDADLWVRAAPFSVRVRAGAARLEGPEGARGLSAGEAWPTNASAGRGGDDRAGAGGDVDRVPVGSAAHAAAARTRGAAGPDPKPGVVGRGVSAETAGAGSAVRGGASKVGPGDPPRGSSADEVAERPARSASEDRAGPNPLEAEGVASAGPGGPRLRAAAEDMGAVYRRARAEPDPEAAVLAFDRVLASGGPWAEMAGHQAVRRRMQSGALEDALRRLSALEARFPAGAHQPEVWLSRIEIRVRQDRLPAAIDDLNRYLARHPDSAKAADLYFLRGEVHRAVGRLDAARADYRRVGRGRYAEAARERLEKE